MTFAEQSDIYLARLSTRKRDPVKTASLATIRSLIKAAKPVLGAMELEVIKSGALRTLAENLSAQEYAPNYISSIVTMVKIIVASDVDADGDPKHLRKWNNGHIFEVVPRKRIHAPDISATKIVELIRKAPPVMRELILTQAATGIRKGEALALTVSDFDHSACVLHVARTLGYYGETSTKTTAGKRDVDIVPQVADMLAGMLADRTTGRLFETTIDKARDAFEELELRSHSLRHFRYTHLQMCYGFLHPALHNYWIGHSQGSGLSARYGHIIKDVALRQEMVRRVGLGFELPVAATEQVREFVTV